MIKKLLLTGLFISGCASLSLAQPNDVSQMTGRINQLENQVQTLSRAVFRGEKPPQGTVTATPANSTSGRALANMDVRLSQLESQIRDLTGQIEEQQYQIRQLSDRMDSGQTGSNTAASGNTGMQASPVGTPQRLGNASPQNNMQQNTAPDPTLSNIPADELYESAFANIRDGNYQQARNGFQAFLDTYPDHKLTSNAQYWLAETYYVGGDYTESARLFAKGYQDYPDSSKTADNLLKLGLSLAKIGKMEDACLSFDQLESQFPNESGPVMRRARQESANLNCD